MCNKCSSLLQGRNESNLKETINSKSSNTCLSKYARFTKFLPQFQLIFLIWNCFENCSLVTPRHVLDSNKRNWINSFSNLVENELKLIQFISRNFLVEAHLNYKLSLINAFQQLENEFNLVHNLFKLILPERVLNSIPNRLS